jgi:Lar family restriction alleviation protein
MHVVANMGVVKIIAMATIAASTLFSGMTGNAAAPNVQAKLIQPTMRKTMDKITYCPKCAEKADRYPYLNKWTCRNWDCGWEGEEPVYLKPCPFCGDAPVLGETAGCDHVVECRKCGVNMHDDMTWDDEGYDSIKNVIGKWNSRAEIAQNKGNDDV